MQREQPKPEHADTQRDRPWRSPEWAESPTHPGRVRSWLYGLVANVAFDAWQEDQRDAGTQAIRAYHNELYARSRQSRHSNVQAGWWAGPPPYGYRRLTRRLRDHHGRLRARHLLALDEQRAPVVAVIYHWYLRDRLSPVAIAKRLAADPDTYPPPLDHDDGEPRPWSRRLVSGVLRNPAYTGYTVWNRTRAGRAQPMRHWIWSLGPSHPALIDATKFKAVHNRRCGASARPARRDTNAAPNRPARDVHAGR